MEHFFVYQGRAYGPKQPLLVAELGTSHGGERAKAKELIHAAQEAGADSVKFQWVYAGEILHPLTGKVALPGGDISLFARFRELERGEDFYAEMKAEAESRGMIFLCTPFGPKSLRELFRLNPALIKIASPELNYDSLLKETASYKLPVVLSSGVSTLGDIEAAVSFFDREKLSLLHCVTAYPAPESDYNLNVLENLRGVFGCHVGVSDHSLDPELVPSLAAALGASVIEKHFCLSRSGGGLDDPIALIPRDFGRMVRAVREAGEAGKEAALDSLRKERGSAMVDAVLGSGVKKLAPAEAENYARTRRSLHAVSDIEAGTVISGSMIAILRTEKKLRPGLAPSWEEKILGRKARRFIPAGEGIRFEDI